MILRFSLGVTRIDKSRNEYIRGAAQVDKIEGETEMVWIWAEDSGHSGQRKLKMELP